MILEISNGQDKVGVEIISNGGRKEIRLGGSVILCDWVRLGDGHYSLIIDGTVHDLHVNLSSETCDVSSRSGTYSLRILDPRHAGSREFGADGQPGVQRLCAEMPGKVVRILAQAGDAVDYDQSLLVLEAMKMQNDIRAPKSGVVKEIAVQAGKTVNTGDFLLSIES